MNLDPDIPLADWALPGEPFRLVAVTVDAVDWPQRLPAAARARTGRFSNPAACASAGASEWLKACWLPEALGLESVAFATGANGKPLLEGAATDWGFNLSHAGGHAVAVLAKGASVGVDLESTARRADIDRLAARVFSDSEQQQVRENGREAFFTLWSQKEALMKALGCGWADGQIQRRTQLRQDAFQTEPATGARLWSRRILDDRYALAVAML